MLDTCHGKKNFFKVCINVFFYYYLYRNISLIVTRPHRHPYSTDVNTLIHFDCIEEYNYFVCYAASSIPICGYKTASKQLIKMLTEISPENLVCRVLLPHKHKIKKNIIYFRQWLFIVSISILPFNRIGNCFGKKTRHHIFTNITYKFTRQNRNRISQTIYNTI